MSVRVGLGVFVLNAKRDRFIVGIRGQSTGIGQGSLAIPGGHLEVGESFEDCARREVIEEAGMELDDVRFGTAVNNLFADGRHYVTIFMTGVAKVGQEPVVSPSLSVSVDDRVNYCVRRKNKFSSGGLTDRDYRRIVSQPSAKDGRGYHISRW